MISNTDIGRYNLNFKLLPSINNQIVEEKFQIETCSFLCFEDYISNCLKYPKWLFGKDWKMIRLLFWKGKRGWWEETLTAGTEVYFYSMLLEQGGKYNKTSWFFSSIIVLIPLNPTTALQSQLIFIFTLAFVVFVKEFQWDQRIDHSKQVQFTVNPKYIFYLKKIPVITVIETKLFAIDFTSPKYIFFLSYEPNQ